MRFFLGICLEKNQCKTNFYGLDTLPFFKQNQQVNLTPVSRPKNVSCQNQSHYALSKMVPTGASKLMSRRSDEVSYSVMKSSSVTSRATSHHLVAEDVHHFIFAPRVHFSCFKCKDSKLVAKRKRSSNES